MREEEKAMKPISDASLAKNEELQMNVARIESEVMERQAALRVAQVAFNDHIVAMRKECEAPLGWLYAANRREFVAPEGQTPAQPNVEPLRRVGRRG